LNVSGRVKLDKETINSEKKMYASTLNVIAENSDKGAYVQSNKNTSQIYADAMLNINKYFYHDTWNLTASLGASLLDLDYKELNFGGGLLTIPNLFTSNNANVSGKLTYKNTNYHDRTNSLFGTFSLGYKGMVYVDGSLRNDWISALAGTNHSSILYPSIGASAILTNMFTMKSNILSYAKVRLSYSEVGNAPERFRAITTYAVLGGLNTTSYFPIKDLKPERTHSWEGGFNLGLFDNKLTLDVTAYKTYTENQLFSPEISTTTGYSKLYVNAGKVTNKGIELALGFKQNIGPVQFTVEGRLVQFRNDLPFFHEAVIVHIYVADDAGDLCTDFYLRHRFDGSRGGHTVTDGIRLYVGHFKLHGHTLLGPCDYGNDCCDGHNGNRDDNFLFFHMASVMFLKVDTFSLIEFEGRF
jgi:outer membrane receptor protein involved in Fe transport